MPQENWTDIHESFISLSETYQRPYWQVWEEKGFTVQEAKQWIEAGFGPWDYDRIKELKGKSFTPQIAEQWIDRGFNSEEIMSWMEISLNFQEANFANYLKQNNYQPWQLTTDNLFQLRKEFYLGYFTAQEWLDRNYPKRRRSSVKELNISGWDFNNQKEKTNWEKLKGHLDLTDFTNLEELDCGQNQITSLNLNGLTQLEKLYCYDNYLTSFDYSSLNPKKLTYLNISDNNLPAQDLSVFSKLTNLQLLWIGGNNESHFTQNIYNKFYGSLEPLKKLTKLEWLWIPETDIDSGLEYLPESVEKFHCSAEYRKNAKIKTIYNLFANEQGVVELEIKRSKWIKNFP